MYQGRTINQLATTLQDIKENSLDFTVPVNHLGKLTAELLTTAESQRGISAEDVLRATEDAIASGDAGSTDDDLMISSWVKDQKHSWSPTAWAHQQIGEYAEIPREYYNRLKGENKILLRDCINHGFVMAAAQAAARRGMTGRMVRTYKGQMRALLSSRYRRLDNFDLFSAVAPSLMDLGFNVESCEITDRRMYIKVVSEKVQGEVSVGDVVCYGLVISGSDVGCGSVKVEPMLYRLVCKNGAICSAAIRQAHIGRNVAGDDIEAFLETDTKQVSDAAFWMQIRDVVANYAKKDFFEQEIQKLREAEGQPIKLFDLPILVERTAKAVGVTLNERLKDVVVANLASGAHGAGMNKWGLSNAFTFGAQDKTLDYDGATDLERAGGKIINLPGTVWTSINSSKKRTDE